MLISIVLTAIATSILFIGITVFAFRNQLTNGITVAEIKEKEPKVIMKTHYDFSSAKRNPYISKPAPTPDNLYALSVILDTDDIVAMDSAREVLAFFFPPIIKMIGYNQDNSMHQYDLWYHSLHTLANLPRDLDDPMVYFAALLHDIGKPDCKIFSRNPADNNAHYRGHAQKSAEIVGNEVLPNLRSKDVYLSDEQEARLLRYIEFHDSVVGAGEEPALAEMRLHRPNEYRHLLHLQIADAKAHAMCPAVERRIQSCTTLLEQIAAEKHNDTDT